MVPRLPIYGSVHVRIGSPFHLSFTEGYLSFLLHKLLLMYSTLPQPTRSRARFARLVIAKSTLGLIGECQATSTIFKVATLSIRWFLVLLFPDCIPYTSYRFGVRSAVRRYCASFSSLQDLKIVHVCVYFTVKVQSLAWFMRDD